MQLPEAQDLANEFTIIIREWLTPDQCREIDVKNAAEMNGGVCHSHDYCDANQAMIDALGRFNVTFDVQDDSQGKLIDAAWGIAKAQGFGVPKEC